MKPQDVAWRIYPHFCNVLATNAWFQLCHESIPEKLKSIDILQNDISILIQRWLNSEKKQKLSPIGGDWEITTSRNVDPGLQLDRGKKFKNRENGEIWIQTVPKS